ncbi:sugar transferase [Chitinophaga sp. 30R24]|uniref:sugar transferase n=1 Tax=Chitinophaga sp. 30R24 TaxID=3248838 RepID=UPI003B9061DF
MDTFMPNLLKIDSIRGLSTGRITSIGAGPEAESIVLFVGHPHKVIFFENDHRYVVAKNVEDARNVIDQLQHVLKRMPVAIIYRFESNFEEALLAWEAFFSENQYLCSIPFFIYVDKGFEGLRQLVAKYSFIDDVIMAEAWNMLNSKIAIVSKFKRMRAFPVYKTSAVPMRKYTRRFYSNFLKRGLDILLALAGLILASPLMLVIAALIRLESKGPIFYAAKRAGSNYRVFKFYKFRTMIPDADKQVEQLQHLNQYDEKKGGPVFFKVSNDPRVTKLGSFLRNSSLDEIPQLLNVLKGDMSLVGNRPLPLYEATTLTTDEYAERFLAPAGITGLWQVSKRGKKDMSVEERIDLDITYANKRSFRYDMWLIVNTPKALVQKDNV